MDFLINLFGLDVFSIVHKYTGQIIEDLKFNEYIEISFIQDQQEKSIMHDAYKKYFTDYPVPIRIGLSTVKIDNALCKIYNIQSESGNKLASVFMLQNVGYFILALYKDVGYHYEYGDRIDDTIIIINMEEYNTISTRELLKWYMCNLNNLLPDVKWSYNDYSFHIRKSYR